MSNYDHRKVLFFMSDAIGGAEGMRDIWEILVVTHLKDHPQTGRHPRVLSPVTENVLF